MPNHLAQQLVFNMLSVVQDIPDIVWIGNIGYAKTQEAHGGALQRLEDAGCEYEPAKAPRKSGTLFLSLDGDRCRFARCTHCQALNSRLGCQAPRGFWCASCGKIMHYRLLPSTIVLLSLPNPSRPDGSMSEVRFAVLDYDRQTKMLALGVTPLKPDYFDEEDVHQQRIFAERLAAAEAILPLVQRKILTDRTAIVDGELVRQPQEPQDAFLLPFDPEAPDGRESPFPIRLIQAGAHYNAQREVILYAGQENEVPFGPSIDTAYLVPAWKHYPLKSSPELHNLLLESANTRHTLFLLEDFFGRHGGWNAARFSDEDLMRIRTAVEHLTTLDLAAYDALAADFPSMHGSEVLLAIAKFCHPEPIIRTSYPGYGKIYNTIPYQRALPLTRSKLGRLPAGRGEDGLYPHQRYTSHVWSGGQVPATHEGDISQHSISADWS